MLQVQYFRFILLLNNITAAALSLNTTYLDYNQWTGAGTILLLSLFFNFAVIGHALWFMQPRKGHGRTRNGYITLQATEETSSGDSSTDSNSKQQGSFNVTVFIALFDFAFAVTHFVFFLTGVVRAFEPIPAVAVVGLAVAVTVHLFFFVYGFQWCLLSQFRVQISIVRRDQESRETANMRAKEIHVKPQSEQQQYEQLSPKPYRGSPSTKPTQEIGTIKLTDATETDTLMDDQE